MVWGQAVSVAPGSLLGKQTLRFQKDPRWCVCTSKCESRGSGGGALQIQPASQHPSGQFPSLSASPMLVTPICLAVSQLPHFCSIFSLVTQTIWAAVYFWWRCFQRVSGATSSVSVFHNNIRAGYGSGALSGDTPLLSGTIHLKLSNAMLSPKHPMPLQDFVLEILTRKVWWVILHQKRNPTLRKAGIGEPFGPHCHPQLLLPLCSIFTSAFPLVYGNNGLTSLSPQLEVQPLCTGLYITPFCIDTPSTRLCYNKCLVNWYQF